MSGARSLAALVGFVAVVFAAALVGSRFPPGEWYAGLTKPSWNPPSWVFAPVWTALYLAIAVAAWRAWRAAGFAEQPGTWALFAVQLALNAAWSWLFFGLQRPDLALLDIAALWLAIAATTAAFWQADRLAGALFVPYLAWVSFAAVLNWTIWRLNA